MSFTEAIRTVWSKYATLTGRATRPEYWWWVLFVVLLSIATNIVDGAILAPMLGFDRYGEFAVQPLSAIVSLVLFLPGICVGVRRLHDIDRSGWWMLIIFIPFIGVLVLLYWLTQRGSDGANRFGVPQGATRPEAHY